MFGSLSRRHLLGSAALASGVLWGGGPALLAAGPARVRAERPAKPLVLGHRGACAHRPEHTLASYAKAIADGADYVEPDLVSTKDGVLVARHENNIAETTNVAARPEFAGRRATKLIDGEKVTGWFTELKTLRARERLGQFRSESWSYDDQFQIVSFDEIIDFVAAESAARGRVVGLIPEIKHSTYFAGIGLAQEARFVATLRAHGYTRVAPIIVQSFEMSNLRALNRTLADMPNVQLMQLTGAPGDVPPDLAAQGSKRTWGEMLAPAGLADIASYADWLSPHYFLLIPRGADGRLGAPTGLAQAAHAAGLLLGTWPFRPENNFIAADFKDASLLLRDDATRNPLASIAEIKHYLALGLDGFFTDDPALGRIAVDLA